MADKFKRCFWRFFRCFFVSVFISLFLVLLFGCYDNSKFLTNKTLPDKDISVLDNTSSKTSRANLQLRNFSNDETLNISNIRSKINFGNRTSFRTLSEVCSHGVCFEVKIAKSPQERIRGLQGVKSLEANEGMLFIFDFPGILSFWMKDMLISLDIIWVDAYGKIIGFFEKVPPCTGDPCLVYKSPPLTKYVLELPAGSVAKYNLSVGEFINATCID